jgi:glucose uptake protein
MLCWGSWGNTQKLAAKTWRYEYFYWDYVLGMLLFSVLIGLTLGSIGDKGRSFIPDLMQVSSGNFWSAFFGGVVFNASNILLSSAISLAGMAVAFPVGVGLALVLGVFINYFSTPSGNPTLIFLGVFLIIIALVLNGIATDARSKAALTSPSKERPLGSYCCRYHHGVLLSFCCGCHGPYELRITPTRHGYAVYGRIHLRIGRFRQQLYLQHLADEKALCG